MHTGFIGNEQQYQIRAADGTILWSGNAIIGKAYLCVNCSGDRQNATPTFGATITSGTAVIVDVQATAPAGSFLVLGRDDNLTTNDPIKGSIGVRGVESAASVGFLGVAVENLVSTPQGTELDSTTLQVQRDGLVAGIGSLCTVKCTSAAAAVGARLGGSGTAALCAVIAAASPTGVTLGQVIKANSQMSTSGLYASGVLVSPL